MKRGRPATRMTATGKICGMCQIDKPLSEFNRSDNRHNHYCKLCEREKYYLKQTEEQLKEKISFHRQSILQIIHHLQERKRKP